MQEIRITEKEAGQRMDKLLAKYLHGAPKSFLYKMLRKKNIKLNNKKAEGKELLADGDAIQIYLSDDTIASFQKQATNHKQHNLQVQPLQASRIVYEDADILIVNKKVGELSQKAKDTDVSVNEQMVAYCRERYGENPLFTPSVCNRLDRNTSGLLLCGISLKGSQLLSEALKERTLDKYYLTIVKGEIPNSQYIDGYLSKDSATNKVTVISKADYLKQPDAYQDADYIETWYEPLKSNGSYTLLRIKLITGKTHQIRAHLSYVGHPIIGDAKYGDAKCNADMKKAFGLSNQLLHAYEIQFPKEGNTPWAGQGFIAKKPERFCRIENALFYTKD